VVFSRILDQGERLMPKLTAVHAFTESQKISEEKLVLEVSDPATFGSFKTTIEFRVLNAGGLAYKLQKALEKLAGNVDGFEMVDKDAKDKYVENCRVCIDELCTILLASAEPMLKARAAMDDLPAGEAA
jgi:hypothetical protein